MRFRNEDGSLVSGPVVLFNTSDETVLYSCLVWSLMSQRLTYRLGTAVQMGPWVSFPTFWEKGADKRVSTSHRLGSCISSSYLSPLNRALIVCMLNLTVNRGDRRMIPAEQWSIDSTGVIWFWLIITRWSKDNQHHWVSTGRLIFFILPLACNH